MSYKNCCHIKTFVKKLSSNVFEDFDKWRKFASFLYQISWRKHSGAVLIFLVIILIPENVNFFYTLTDHNLIMSMDKSRGLFILAVINKTRKADNPYMQ